LISPCTDKEKQLSLNEQLEVLGISKGAYYYKPVEPSETDDQMMKAIDKEHLEHPTKGVVSMRDFLLLMGFIVGVRHVRRLMHKMAIHAIYPQACLSKNANAKYKQPYLLRKLKIDHPNQVWSTDITYIPMRKGFMYLYAIIDVYSRCIMAWGLYNTLESENAIEVLEKAIEMNGAPEIINSDQGSQYTSEKWMESCSKYKSMRISMDGRARCLDNIWIERFWRTIKQEYIYLNPVDGVIELKEGIGKYIEYYNKKRPHQGIEHKVPYEMYSAA